MSESPNKVVFFDIGDTLGVPIFTLPPPRLRGLDVFPYVHDELQALRAHNVRLGIISNTGDDTGEAVDGVLEASGILDVFESQLRIYSKDVGFTKASPEIFRLAAERAGHAATPHNCLFVGEDKEERRVAREAGFLVAPHPRLAWEVLNGSHLLYVRIRVPYHQRHREWRQALRALPVVPLYVTGEEGRQLYAITTRQAALQLDDLGFEVDRLGREDDPLEREVFLLRDDRQTRSGFLTPEGQSNALFSGNDDAHCLLCSAREGLFVALPAGYTINRYHMQEARHGHTQKLLPDMGLFQSAAPAPQGSSVAALAATAPLAPGLAPEEVQYLRAITPELIRDHVERYAGQKPVQPAEPARITSRHIRHQDNVQATYALARDLESMGNGKFTVSVQRFLHEGHELYNIEAELPGADATLRNEIVLITAHMDSTAAFSDGPYDPVTDPAPGADDDASGVAAVLSVAQVIRNLADTKPPLRTLRFVLFNAEEEGLIGSKAYARWQATRGATIVAVYQMDMVGYRGTNEAPPRPFEVHAGYAPSPAVEARSLVLGQHIARLVGEVASDLKPPQIYQTQTTPPASDPAERRSDHGSFNERGYAACAISEDFFGGPHGDDPVPQPNPNYHKNTDTVVHFAYAADIARVVGAAAVVSANAPASV